MSDAPAPSKPTNFPKAFGLGGLVLGEIYMFFTVLAPNTAGVAVVSALSMVSQAAFTAVGPSLADFSSPIGAKLGRVAVCGVLFGLFGALLGTGVGVAVDAIARRFRR